jgi:hypothetical protein
MNDEIFTVGELRMLLEAYPDDCELKFYGELTFSRIKRRGDNLCFLEFNEPQAIFSSKRFPSVKAMFLHASTFEDGEPIQGYDPEVR